ncbi:MAG: DUF1080 domain-containing protein [Rhodothermaceae bacterium]|nr:DUF1080 domain-containing protein [Rhodothermaceae bacterium]MXX59477.1 DUF1080 domain-containing protein [Rhodothermaceae bacterium]MYD19882.1 DUF1080 domain-containing protein [Rhodothermaceae bacterium]MYD55417.1 DUF1080 domain-containing protein [Rhodothermaceae bacterium]MYI42303.1 DUF1080 domain-containing protein [Rhodothermaceae bacterium]
MAMRLFIAATFAAATLVGCQSASENTSSAEVDDEELAMSEEMPWQTLGADQWRRYGGEGIPEAWQISDDGVFHFTGEGEGGDIITVEQYDNFELELEWKISPAGNSGIMFRVSEDHDYP